MQEYPVPRGGTLEVDALDCEAALDPHARLCMLLAGHERADVAEFTALAPLADAHAVLPLLRERVLVGLSAPYGDAGDGLRDAALRDAALEARRNARVSTALSALAAAGVPALVFKGTALAHSHYARPELRARDDTDVLVDPAHAAVAETVFGRLGYAPAPGIEGALIMRQRLHRVRDADGVLHNLDLHWAVSNSVRARALSPRALLARSRPLPALGGCARGPCDEDALLIACLHLDAHHPGDVRLGWLHDVHLVVGAMPVDARRRATSAALAAGLGDACAWVLARTRAAFATPLDGFDALLTAPRASAPSSRRAAQWLRELSHLPGARERLSWLSQHLFPPIGFLRTRDGHDAPAWRLYARRMLRGVRHLFGR